ncbi:hypothetical protein GGR52DRAFT_574159 [Hypoxylon sp. FL1284]|nr:hypothetical protein GGR52DRAFT_574159 [Hypoxylon sp. FL1284]
MLGAVLGGLATTNKKNEEWNRDLIRRHSVDGSGIVTPLDYPFTSPNWELGEPNRQLMLLRNLEKLMYKKDTPRLPDQTLSATYFVRTEDLQAVEQAVGNCKDLGLPMFASVKERAAIASNDRGFDFPNTYDQVRRLQIEHYKKTKHRLEMRVATAQLRDARPPPGEAPPEQDEEADDSLGSQRGRDEDEDEDVDMDVGLNWYQDEPAGDADPAEPQLRRQLEWK